MSFGVSDLKETCPVTVPSWSILIVITRATSPPGLKRGNRRVVALSRSLATASGREPFSVRIKAEMNNFFKYPNTIYYRLHNFSIESTNKYFFLTRSVYHLRKVINTFFSEMTQRSLLKWSADHLLAARLLSSLRKCYW